MHERKHETGPWDQGFENGVFGDTEAPQSDRLRWEPIFPTDEPLSGKHPKLPAGNRPPLLPRLIAIALFGLAIAVGFTFLKEIKAFIGVIPLAISNDPREQVKGLAAFGLCLVAILAAMRIALNGNDRNRN